MSIMLTAARRRHSATYSGIPENSIVRCIVGGTIPIGSRSAPPLPALLAIAGAEAIFAARAVGSKRFDQPALPLGDEHRPAIGAAKRQIGRLLGGQPDFALLRA